jgi:hypothetical protein
VTKAQVVSLPGDQSAALYSPYISRMFGVGFFVFSVSAGSEQLLVSCNYVGFVSMLVC